MNEFEKKIWTIKYRPYMIEDIIGNNISISVFENLLASKKYLSLNFILAGPIGSGKKSSFLSYIYEICGYEIKNNILYFDILDYLNYGKTYIFENSSIPNVIKALFDPSKSLLINFKKIIKYYCSMSSLDNKGYKIIYFNSSEYLTYDMQYSLRRILEKKKNCNFIFSTRNLFKLIKPIKSRCITLYFNYPETKDLFNYISKIFKLENIYYEKYFIKKLGFFTNNNTEICLLILQSLIVNDKLEMKNLFKLKFISEKIFFFNKFIDILNAENINNTIKSIEDLFKKINTPIEELFLFLLNKIIS